MQPNNTPTEKSTSKPNKLIAHIYNKQAQKLDLGLSDYYLDSCVDDWRGVLSLRDWSMLRELVLCKIYNSLDGCNIGDSGAEFFGSLPWPNL